MHHISFFIFEPYLPWSIHSVWFLTVAVTFSLLVDWRRLEARSPASQWICRRLGKLSLSCVFTRCPSTACHCKSYFMDTLSQLFSMIKEHFDLVRRFVSNSLTAWFFSFFLIVLVTTVELLGISWDNTQHHSQWRTLCIVKLHCCATFCFVII